MFKLSRSLGNGIRTLARKITSFRFLEKGFCAVGLELSAYPKEFGCLWGYMILILPKFNPLLPKSIQFFLFFCYGMRLHPPLFLLWDAAASPAPTALVIGNTFAGKCTRSLENSSPLHSDGWKGFKIFNPNTITFSHG